MKDNKTTGKDEEPQRPGRTGAQCVVDGLVKAGCEVLFGYPGGAVLDIFNCLYDAPFNFVLTRHEQGAVHMADGYARATGQSEEYTKPQFQKYLVTDFSRIKNGGVIAVDRVTTRRQETSGSGVIP